MTPQRLIMDSGAFTVWTQGGEVDLDAYIDFCLDHLDVIDYIVALDVIPGKPGDRLSMTKKNIDKACELGWVNYRHMIDRGLPVDRVIPVFHQGDDMKWLEKFMEEEIPYFGISPANDKNSNQRQWWLDQCMNLVCDKKGMPLAKFHGFAVTSVRLMVRYPWYSCDSASWLKLAAYGRVLIPWSLPDGSWDYIRPAWNLFFSTKSPAIKDKGTHYGNLNPAEKKAVDRYLEEHDIPIGTSEILEVDADYKPAQGEVILEKFDDGSKKIERPIIEGLSNSVTVRGRANCIYLNEVASHLEWPRPFKGARRRLL